ncbi:hypothetical protein H7H52_12350 [Mycolicibacter hiberniae]|uniref:NHL repeat-containing protein n=1 Tax=Mycolicibacter hiberniae TaxID=29314 RepID=UPI0013D46A6A|nr:NHL repeat-containing protein [Mycolicibacter hiberniae]MCV7086515.1 hypothetical protein [Mycolicibacter hiberniae]
MPTPVNAAPVSRWSVPAQPPRRANTGRWSSTTPPVGLIAAILVLLACCGTACGHTAVHAEKIDKSTFKGTWPLKVDSGVLACDGGAVTFTSTDTNDTYALNALASKATDKSWQPDSEHIWLAAAGGHEGNPGVSRTSMTDLINEGLKLCGPPWDMPSTTPQPDATPSTAVAADAAGPQADLQTTQLELPFTDLDRPGGVAVDRAGNIYVADTGNARVLKLPVGSNRQAMLPFTGLLNPDSVAVDQAGNVYVTDYGSNSVLKLSGKSKKQTKLPFTGLKAPTGTAVDVAGNVYVTDYGNHRALILMAGSKAPVELKLPFVGLTAPTGIAVDQAGNKYLTGYGNAQVLKLLAGSSTPVKLPFTRFTGPNPPNGVAVDTKGNVYVVDGLHQRVVELPAQSTRQVELAFGTGAGNPRSGVAVDRAGNVYVSDNHRVLKLSRE